MVEGQKKRKIGAGMKPRGNKRVKPQKETKSMTEQSIVEGHATPQEEAVFEVQEGNETPGNLEPENGEKTVQNLENSEAMVAHDDGHREADEQAGMELLAAMDESSNEVIETEFNEVDESTEMEQVLGEPAGTDLETAIAVGTGTVKDLQPTLTGIGGKPLESEIVAVRPPLDGKNFPHVGPQPDGSEKFIITIQEGYTEAVRQWAEADGVDVSRWLSDRLYEYISTYGEPAKGR